MEISKSKKLVMVILIPIVFFLVIGSTIFLVFRAKKIEKKEQEKLTKIENIGFIKDNPRILVYKKGDGSCFYKLEREGTELSQVPSSDLCDINDIYLIDDFTASGTSFLPDPKVTGELKGKLCQKQHSKRLRMWGHKSRWRSVENSLLRLTLKLRTLNTQLAKPDTVEPPHYLFRTSADACSAAKMSSPRSVPTWMRCTRTLLNASSPTRER